MEFKPDDIRRDFEFMQGKAMAVVLFGSLARGEETGRSDTDICLISPEIPLIEVLGRIGNKYDVKVFEHLPLALKMEIIRNHEILLGDELELSWYLRRFRKLWSDVERRMEEYSFNSADEMLKTRRRWLDEKRAKVS
ncbi:MAG: nucleotidyltransferase domain-containing protein [Candidatus Altiarchaeota archaeon]|nr:nucleotidyltransferase domain-containing protein [Candidatus Altiarchaeota archaeon]